jgi:regulatory protein
MRRSRSPLAPTDTPARPVKPKTADEARAALMEYALRALAQRALSAAELRTRLLKRTRYPEYIQNIDDPDQANADLISAVLERLIELKYLDDTQVARSEGLRRGVGAFRIRARLKQRGVENEVIEATLQARDPDEDLSQAAELLQKRLSNLRRGSNPRAKAYGLLARRGYGGDIIRKALDTVDWSATGADEDELLGGEDWPGEE